MQKLISTRQQLDAQLNENKVVQEVKNSFTNKKDSYSSLPCHQLRLCQLGLVVQSGNKLFQDCCQMLNTSNYFM